MADFKIYSSTGLSGVSLVEPQHEDAWRFLSDECDVYVMQNGNAAMATDAVGDFISDCASVYLDCEYL